MALLLEIDFPGVTAEQYDSVDTAVGTRSPHAPKGLLFHSAVITDAGLHVVDLWESPEDLEVFMTELAAVAGDAGFPAVAPPTPKEAHHYYLQK